MRGTGLQINTEVMHMKLTIELSEDTFKELRERYVYFSDTLEGRILKAVSEGIPVNAWNCSSCEHTDDECRDCYPELGCQ